MKDITLALILVVLLIISNRSGKILQVLEKTYELEERNNYEYQIVWEDDKIVVWHNNTLVGILEDKNTGDLEKLLIKDNE